MHNEIVWIVKEGQRDQVSAWFHDHYNKLLKFLQQFLIGMLQFLTVMNAVIVDLDYKDRHSSSMTRCAAENSLAF